MSPESTRKCTGNPLTACRRMKYAVCLLGFVLSLLSLCAQDYQADFIIANRDFFRNLAPADLVPVTLSRTWIHAPQAPADAWQREIHAGKNFQMPEGNGIDLDGFFEELPAANKAITYLYNEFTAEKDGIAQIGIGADWWFEAACNGAVIASTFRTGNGSGSFAPENNPFFIPVRKGRNLLAVKVRRGGYTWNFTCGNVPFSPPPQVLAELAVGPWLTHPDTGAVTVRFASDGRLHAGVEYREAGKPESAKIQWDALNGVIRKDDFHTVRLSGLTPGKTYEYRVVFLHPRDLKKLVYPQGEKFHRYSCPAENLDAFSFLFVADLQFPTERQHRILRQLLSIGGFESCSFIVFGGDLNSTLVKEEMLNGICRILSASGGASIPAVIVRGNHELTGPNPEVFSELFAGPDGKSYGTFRYGSAAFLNFDSFSQVPQLKRAGITTGEQFMAEQEQFLQKALVAPEWTGAARRFVVAHSAPYSRDDEAPMCGMTRKLTDPFFAGRNPRSRLDLWLGAHTHRYSRGIPGKAEVVTWLPMEGKVTVTGENYTFPVLTNAGPEAKYQEKASVFRVDVQKERIIFTAWLADGKCLEKIIFHNDGKTEEIISLRKK